MTSCRTGARFALRISLASVIAFALTGCSSTQNDDSVAVVNQTVEAACGQCQFGMSEPASCDLAIRMNGNVYFVDGASIDDFGDAHAADGFCQAIRTARVSGTIEDGRFRATAFEILPAGEGGRAPE